MHITTTTAASSGSLVLSSHQVFWVAIGAGIITLIVVSMPVLLARAYHKGVEKGAASTLPPRPSLFEIPYITWFIVHYTVAILAILAILLLGFDDVIDKGTVSALLGSLFGYVLGSAAHTARPPSDNSKSNPPAQQTPQVPPSTTPS